MTEPIILECNIGDVKFVGGQGNQTKLVLIIPESYHLAATKLFALGKERVIKCRFEYGE